MPAHHVKSIQGYTQLCFTVVKETPWTDGFSHRSYSRSIRRQLQRQIPQASRFPVWLFSLTGVRFLKSQCPILDIVVQFTFLLDFYQYFYWSSQRTCSEKGPAVSRVHDGSLKRCCCFSEQAESCRMMSHSQVLDLWLV